MPPIGPLLGPDRGPPELAGLGWAGAYRQEWGAQQAAGDGLLGLLLLLGVTVLAFRLGRAHRSRGWPEPAAELGVTYLAGLAAVLAAFTLASWVDSDAAWLAMGALPLAVYGWCAYRAARTGGTAPDERPVYRRPRRRGIRQGSRRVRGWRGWVGRWAAWASGKHRALLRRWGRRQRD
jgi:hypothetical protein